MKEHVIIGKGRSVSVPNSLKKIGIQYDHNVNTITFDCPRYPDEDSSVDMSQMHIFLNYMLPDKTMDCSMMENIVVDEEDPTIMHFDWVIKRNHTRVNGVLSTLICVKQTDAEGNEIYHWNTDLFQSFSVGNGMECSEQIVDMNPDVITQLLVRMGEVDNRTSAEAMQGYVNIYMEENPIQPSQEQLDNSVDAYLNENPPSPSDQQVSDSVNVYLNQNPPTPTDEQAANGVGNYMSDHAQGLVDNYLTEHPVTPTEEQMKNGVAANTELLQNSVDDYLGRNPLQLDEGLSESSKAAPANKVGEIQSDVTELKGDLDDKQHQINNIENTLYDSLVKANCTTVTTKTPSSTFNGWSTPVSKEWLGNGKIKNVKFNISTSTSGNGVISILKSDNSTIIDSKPFSFDGTIGQDVIVNFDVFVEDDIFYLAIETDRENDAVLMTSGGYYSLDRDLLALLSNTHVYYKYASTGWQDIGTYGSSDWCSTYYEITTIKEKEIIDDKYKPSLNIGSKLYAIVGDTLQVFKDSIVESVSDEYIIQIVCSKGRNYPRYWEYTPAPSDVGTTTLTIKLLNGKGEIIDSKDVSLITKTASDNTINILNIGDSTMYGGEIPIELSRRLKGTNGVATSPEPLNLSNINLVGRLKNTDKTVGWEGTGGWTYANYLSEGNHAVRFNVSNANAISLGDLIRVSATNSKGYYQFQVVEINVTSGIGNIRAMFHTTPWTSTFSNEVASSGNITNSNGINVGEYTSYSEEYFQPFWNNTTNSFDIATYVNQYCNDKCDYIFILLGINSLFIKKPWDNIESIFADCKSLLRKIHEQLPNAKILLSTNHYTSQNGGLGANYGCNTAFGQYDVKAINHLLNRMNEMYFTLESDSEFSGYVTVVNTHAQFDAEHGFPYEEKKVNTSCDEKEHIGTNGVHPSNVGYWQIADAEFRAVLGI